jgi:hypothetical protein
MKTRPKIVDLIALFLVGVAISMPLQIMFLYGHSPFEVRAIAAKLTPLNWAIMFLAPLAAWLVHRCSPLVLAVVPILAAVVVHNNWFVAELSTDYPPLVAALGTGVFLIVMGVLVTREIRELIMNPERRWWFTPKRLRAEVPMLIGRTGRQFYALSFDISESGAFIPLGRELAKYLPADLPLKVGTRCPIFFTLRKLCSIQCEAEVVRATPARGNYPAGIGLKFHGLDRQKRRLLNEFIERNAVELAVAA